MPVNEFPRQPQFLTIMKPTFFHKLDDFDDFVVILTKNMVSKAVQEITMFFSK